MVRRKKQYEQLAEGDNSAVVSTEEEPKTATIQDFYLPQKIAAFHQAYNPVEEETLQSEIFTEARLREFFKAYVLPAQGDPLQLYLDALAAHGFYMSVTMAGEPAIIVEPRYQ